ncbi:MAG: pilus assembly protein PilM [Dysgonamonadaceae bacterium]|jgi:cell division protein FtsA|nr:pilus assembly protein PilM [Dysgonamonadaceae bacterium]
MEQIIAAVDIGTSKIVAMAARKTPSAYAIIASETRTLDTEDAKALVVRGLITDIAATAKIITDVLHKLGQRLEEQQLRLEKVYVGYGGQGLHTESFTLKRNMAGAEIAEEDLQSFSDELGEYPGYSNIRSFLSSYFLDGRQETDITGKTCDKLENRCLLLTGHNNNDELKKQIDLRSGGKYRVEKVLVSPEATAYSVLEENEWKDGCALVETGAGVTVVSIHHNNELKFMSTVPIGGQAITKDICSLKIPFAEAENHKIKYGDTTNISSEPVDVNLLTEEEKLQALNNIVAARVKEIAGNVYEQIVYSRLAEYVNSLVITGGGASLKGLDVIFRDITGMQVRIAAPKRTFVKQDMEESLNPANAAVIGMFGMATENCCKEIVKRTVVTTQDTNDEPQGTSVINAVGKLGHWAKTLFDQSETEKPKQSEVPVSLEEKEQQRIEKEKHKMEEAREKAERDAQKAQEKLERERAEQERKKEKEEARLAENKRKQELAEKKRREKEKNENQPSLFEKLAETLFTDPTENKSEVQNNNHN